MNWLEKIIKADPDRKTRFHDLKGNAPDLRGWLYLPEAFVTTVLRHLLKYQVAMPWISYRMIHLLDRFIQPSSQVLEFGAGMSTLWFATRCKHIVSIESDPVWYEIVSRELVRKGLAHKVTLLLRTNKDYSDLSVFQDGVFDFCLVDGIYRSECVRNTIPKMKLGGWLYLDNVDATENLDAELQVREIASRFNWQIKYFVDFVPTALHPNQGVMLVLGK